MAESYRRLYQGLNRTLTRFSDVFIKAELDCTATVSVEHGGETHVVMWDGLSSRKDFWVLERNGGEVAHRRDWRDPSRPDHMAAVAVAIKPLYDEARKVVNANRLLLEEASRVLHNAVEKTDSTTEPSPDEHEPQPSDEPSEWPESPEPSLQ